MEVFNRAVEGRSFAAAARALGVTTSAVAQTVAQLERSLGEGVVLLHRTAQGVSLTAAGERYYEVSRRIVMEVRDVAERLVTRGTKPRGTLTVGMRPFVAQLLVMPQIMVFMERYPDVELVMRSVTTMRDVDEKHMDVAVLVGWPSKGTMIVRQLLQTRHVVCASREYWARAGKPREPEDLLAHDCVVVRSTSGGLLDRWAFERDGDRRVVNVKTRLCSDDRTWLEEAACGGVGVVRFSDISLGKSLATGLLVPVLEDWEALEAPTIFCAYWQRRSRLVQAFVEFLVELFEEVERDRPLLTGKAVPWVPKPRWFESTHGRISAYTERGR